MLSAFGRRASKGTASVADPYHVDTDPDPGCEKIRYGSGSRANFDTDPDPGKNDTDPDPAKKDRVPGNSLKSDKTSLISHV